jgi:hypothetical protein
MPHCISNKPPGAVWDDAFSWAHTMACSTSQWHVQHIHQYHDRCQVYCSHALSNHIALPSTTKKGMEPKTWQCHKCLRSPDSAASCVALHAQLQGQGSDRGVPGAGEQAHA